MSQNIRNTNLRFNLNKEEQKKAWNYLQSMDRQMFKSYSYAITTAVNDYFERLYHQEEDPYFETREREERFVMQIIEAVQTTLTQLLPYYLSGCLAGFQQREPRNGAPFGTDSNFRIGTGSAAMSECPKATTSDPNASDVDWDFLGE